MFAETYKDFPASNGHLYEWDTSPGVVPYAAAPSMYFLLSLPVRQPSPR
jgi:hypothetical protein